MNPTHIFYNQGSVPVHLAGTDQKLIPSLLTALKNNKITLSTIKENPVRIDLFGSEAILHFPEGDKYRIPIF